MVEPLYHTYYFRNHFGRFRRFLGPSKKMGEGTVVSFHPRLWFLGGMVCCFFMAATAPAQDAIPSPSPDPNQIKQDLLQNKKGLADIQKKLSAEKKQQLRDMAKEKNIL